MSIYMLLEKKQKKRNSFYKSEDFLFYQKNKSLLTKYKKFVFLSDVSDDFSIYRANILINGLINKSLIEADILNFQRLINEGTKFSNEEMLKSLRERTSSLPYYNNGQKIYIPFFSNTLNLVYSEEPMKLMDEPYSELTENFDNMIIDAFDVYGSNLYNSYFTHLVKVGEHKNQSAFYSFDTDTLYFVNIQGRLDCKLVFFDKYIKNINRNHIMERIKPVVDAYYEDEREKMLNALRENSFISQKMFYLLIRDWKKKHR